MTYLTLVSVALATCSLFFLRLMPSQKEHVRQLAQQPPSLIAGRCMLVLLAFLMVVGTGFAILPMLPATACLRVAGGSGC